MFESNSRCARGQGLNMKVPGCGVSQQRTGFQWEHSLLEGGTSPVSCILSVHRSGMRPRFGGKF